jgi:hypothetical protein
VSHALLTVALPSPRTQRFDFFAPPILQLVSPRGAPPGTSITLVGVNLDGAGLAGVAHWCRFGDALVRGEPQPEARVVDNSWFTHTVRCVVPETPHVEPSVVMGGGEDGQFFAPPTVRHEGGGSVPLSVSLNGQQFTAPLSFSIHRRADVL